MSTYTESVAVEGTLGLRGVWLHDPEVGGVETAANFLFGANQRGDSINVMGVESFFAGRTYPVMDFGEHLDVTANVVIDVPHGPTWQAELETLDGFASGRKTLVYRDNRGRAFHGTISNYQKKDQGWGTEVSFAVSRTDWVIETVD